MPKAAPLRLAAVVALVAAAGAVLIFLPWKDYLQRLLEQVEQLGPWGPVVLAACYVPAAVLFVPGSLLTLGAGFAFGVGTGTVAMSLGSTAGAAAAFLVGRTLARGWVEKQIAANPRFQALDQAVGDQGFKIVLLARLSPVFPYNLLNYAFGLTRVSFRDYVLASWIGMLPGTLLYVYLGSAVKSLADLFTGHVAGGVGQQVLFFVGLAATVAVTVLVTRVAKRALERAVPRVASEASAPLQGESRV